MYRKKTLINYTATQCNGTTTGGAFYVASVCEFEDLIE